VSLVYNVLVFLHLIGMAMLVGGFFSQLRAQPRLVTQWMRDGALTQVLTGLVLAGMAGSSVGTDDTFSPAAIGTKLVVAIVVAALCLFGMRQPEDKQQTYWLAAGALALANVAVAVFWLTA
jgi:hypothetical protein